MNKIRLTVALWNIDHDIIDGVLMIYLYFSNLSDHLKQFQGYLNSCHVNMSFTIETEQNSKTSFLDVNVICEQGKSITSVYRKPTFSGVYTHFDSFLTDTYKIGMIYTSANRCFRIRSSWSMFYQQLILLREMFQKKWLSRKLH